MRIDLRDRDDCRDSQDIAPIAQCIHCGGEIYTGDMVYIPDGYVGMVCTDCVKDWIYETYAHSLGTRCEVKETRT